MRTVPPALQAHLEQDTTTTCYLLRFDLKDGESFGMTTLDRNVVYEGVTYYAANGFDASTMESGASYSVDNAEGQALLATDVPGITLQDVRVGRLDDAEWIMMLVNWNDLTMGHVIIDAGDVGEVTVVDGVVMMPELLSYAMRLRQPIGHVDSRSCRAIFGTPAGSHTGCGVDAEALWQNGTVITVDSSEPSSVFSTGGLTGEFSPGRLQWLTGNNASDRLYQIEQYADQAIEMFETMPYPIAVNDTFRIRPDCAKSEAACKAYGNYINMKAEPKIPVGDGPGSLTPLSKDNVVDVWRGPLTIESVIEARKIFTVSGFATEDISGYTVSNVRFIGIDGIQDSSVYQVESFDSETYQITLKYMVPANISIGDQLQYQREAL